MKLNRSANIGIKTKSVPPLNLNKIIHFQQSNNMDTNLNNISIEKLKEIELSNIQQEITSARTF